MKSVLVVDQAGGMAEQIRQAMTDGSWRVRRVLSAEEVPLAIRGDTRLLVLNPCIQPETAFGTLERLVRTLGSVPFVVLAGCAPVEAASRALFPRAAGVLRLPLPVAVLREKLLEAAGSWNGDRERHAQLSGLGDIVGDSPPMRALYRRIRTAAHSDAAVLLTGETGSGKELVARTIHELSPRRDGPFVVVNCTELAEGLVESELFGHVRGAFTGASRDKMGLFEAAKGGTVLLDEMGDASLAVQGRLLRVVEERQVRRVGDVHARPVDVRIIAATQTDLTKLVRSGRFREDLYYRLRVLRLDLPPLSQRAEDIPALVARYLERHAGPDGTARHCTPLALEALKSHGWPGNVRELFATLEAAVTVKRAGAIDVGDLPKEVRTAFSLRGKDAEQTDLILRALEETDGHRGRAAELLGMSRTTLWRRLTQLGIS